MTLRKKYVPKIITPRKTSEEFISHLQSKVKCSKAEVPALDSFFMKLMIQNVIHCILNKDGYTEADLEFEYYLVEHNDDTDHYYQEMLSRQTPVLYKPIYVLIERKTGWMTSNSQVLLLESFIERGIDPEDLEANNIFAQDYLFKIDSYKENY